MRVKIQMIQRIEINGRNLDEKAARKHLADHSFRVVADIVGEKKRDRLMILGERMLGPAL